MKKIPGKISVVATIALMSVGSAHAIPVTINTTADNFYSLKLCFDETCSTTDLLREDSGDWRDWDTVALNLDPGTYWFTWDVENSGTASSDNPSALLAEIWWNGQASYSSSDWDIIDPDTGTWLADATDWGSNGGANIWTSVNGGAISGVSANASWIYTADNFASAPSSASFRTSITIVPEPTTLSLLGMSLLGVGLLRRRKRV